MNKFSLFLTSSLITLGCALEAVVVESNDNAPEQATIVKTKPEAPKEKRDIYRSPKQLEKLKDEQRALESEIVQVCGGFSDEITPKINVVQELLSLPTIQDTISKLNKEEQGLFKEIKNKILPVQSLLLKHIDEFRDRFLLAETLTGEEEIFAPLKSAISLLGHGSTLLREKGLSEAATKMEKLASSYNGHLQKLISIEPKRRTDFIDAVSLWSPFWQNLYFVPLSSAKKMLGFDFSSLTYDESKLATKFGPFYFKRAYDMSSPYYFGTESGEFKINVAGELRAYLFNRLFIGSGTASTSSIFITHFPLLVASKGSELHTEFQHSTSIHADKKYKKSGMSVITENPSRQYSFMRTLHTFPVLISGEARGETFWEWAEKGKPLANFSEIFLHDLWSLYQDGKHNNSHIENGVVQGFDRELAFGFPFIKGKEGIHYPQLRSVFMVGRKETDDPLNKELFDRLTRNNPHTSILYFFHELSQIQKQFEEKLRTGKISREQYEKSGFPLQISTYYVDFLLSSLKQLRTYKGKEPPTHREIFRFTSPLLERYYSALYSLYQSDAKAAFNDLYNYSKKTSIEKVLSDELVSGSLAESYAQMKEDLESSKSQPVSLRDAVSHLLASTDIGEYSKPTQVKILQAAWSLFPELFKTIENPAWLNIDLIKKSIEKKVSPDFLTSYLSKCKGKVEISKKELKSLVEKIIGGDKGLIKGYLLAIRRSYPLPNRVISLLRKQGFAALLHEFAEADKVGNLHVLPIERLEDILVIADLGDVRTRSSLLRVNKWFNQKLNAEKMVTTALTQSWRFIEENGCSAFRFLRGAVFERIGLKGFQFAYSDLTDAKFSQSSLEDTLYVHCRLDGAKFSTSISEGATFIGPVTNVSFSNLDHASQMNFTQAFLNSVKFEGVQMSGSKLDGCNAESVTFVGCDLSDSSMQGASLKDASIKDSFINKINFAGSTLQNFRLQISDAYEIEDSDHAPNFEGATLEDVNMEKVFLGRVNFNNSTLNRFNGIGIIARNSSWKNVKGEDIILLSDGTYDGAEFIEWVVKSTAFTGASLDRATLLNCSFRENVDLRKITGGNIIFNESDLSRARWDGARIKRPYFLSASVDSIVVKKEKGIVSPAFTIEDLNKEELKEFNLSQETYL